MTQISLNGDDWQIKDYYGEDWRWRDSHISVRYESGAGYPASVPGSIANDLLTAGEIPTPYFERNSRLIEWIPARTWVYRKTFSLDSNLAGQRAQLRFEGIDYEGQIFLNGEYLGTHVGMYTPATYEVGQLLRFDKDNVIAVVIAPAPHEEPQVGRTSRVRTHKSRMTYWWDFCPRMIHLGIWNDVTLQFTRDVRIEDVFVRPRLTDDFKQADITVRTRVNAKNCDHVTADIIIRYEDRVVTQQSIKQDLQGENSSFDVTLPVEIPHLWYPNGHGDQPLYTAEVCLVDAEGQLFDQHTVRFGIRKIEFVQNETSDPTSQPYTLVVNGKQIYIKGWNWVPMDAMYGVPRPAKLRHLMTLAQRAHVNLLRIWGGGLIEKEAFYNLCDECGILVWQEFIQSSSGIDNIPPTDPDMIAWMVEEAKQIILLKRNHPSLAIWCGGNELTGKGEIPLDNTHPMLGALQSVVLEYDPDRIWLATSPTGRVFANSLDNILTDPTALHDVHGPWEYQGVTEHYTLYNQGTALLHSEFGVEGLTNLKSLNATIAPENQFPVSLKNQVWHHLGAWWVKEGMWRDTFGDVDTIEALVKATQLMQFDGLRYALEASRQRKYQSSGTLPWQFNEPFPMGACTSAIDYYQQPKPVYYGVAKAYEPVHISAKFPRIAWAGQTDFTAEIWVNNSIDSIESSRVLIQLLDINGNTCYESSYDDLNFAPNTTTSVTEIQVSLDNIASDVFFLDIWLASGETLSHNRYSITQGTNLHPLLEVPQTQLSINRQQSDNFDHLTITNVGEHAALFIWLEDAHSVQSNNYVYWEDNHFCLMPQETRHITGIWEDTPIDNRMIQVQAWNTEQWSEI